MKIVITGSLGHISRPLATGLISRKGHDVTIISSKPEKTKEIEALGASAAIGSIEDVHFLTRVFKGADIVYCMIPPNYHLDPTIGLMEYCIQIGNNYAQAIGSSGVKKVIHLSSIGAHLDKNAGLILAHHAVETILGSIQGITIKHMRPVAFYYNLYAFIPTIKKEGRIASNYGQHDKIPWVSPTDIANAVIEEIESPAFTFKIRYIASDEPTCDEIATTLGTAIGIPGLQWETISNEQMQHRLESSGMNQQLASGLVEMNASMHSGLLLEDYRSHRPDLGNVKISDFAKEFSAAYLSK